MPFPQRWSDEEKTLILVDFPERFTWTEYHESVAITAEMIRGVDHVVDVISDVTNSKLPKGNPFPQFYRLINALPPNTGAVINFGASGVERALASAFLYVYRRRYNSLSLHVVGTFEDAQEIVARRRQQSAARM